MSSATGNPEHYSTAMVGTLPKFDPTEDSSLAIVMALTGKPQGIKAASKLQQDSKEELIEKKSQTSFQFGGYISLTNSAQSMPGNSPPFKPAGGATDFDLIKSMTEL